MKMYIHKESNSFPIYENQLLQEYPNIGDNFWPEEYARVDYTEPPVIDHEKQRCVYQVVLLDGKYKLRWQIINLQEERKQILEKNEHKKEISQKIKKFLSKKENDSI
jgi:hypothetical protein